MLEIDSVWGTDIHRQNYVLPGLPILTWVMPNSELCPGIDNIWEACVSDLAHVLCFYQCANELFPSSVYGYLNHQVGESPYETETTDSKKCVIRRKVKDFAIRGNCMFYKAELGRTGFCLGQYSPGEGTPRTQIGITTELQQVSWLLRNVLFYHKVFRVN